MTFHPDNNLPDCMLPDGGDCCGGYQALLADWRGLVRSSAARASLQSATTTAGEPNDECYCDFESRRFFGSNETAHDPVCPQYDAAPSLLKRARQFIADAGCDEDDSEVNTARNKLLAEIDAAPAADAVAGEAEEITKAEMDAIEEAAIAGRPLTISSISSDAVAGDAKPVDPDGLNGCMRVAAQALDFLANYERPIGGSQNYNSEHLMQLASELRRTSASISSTNCGSGK